MPNALGPGTGKLACWAIRIFVATALDSLRATCPTITICAHARVVRCDTFGVDHTTPKDGRQLTLASDARCLSARVVDRTLGSINAASGDRSPKALGANTFGTHARSTGTVERTAATSRYLRRRTYTTRAHLFRALITIVAITVYLATVFESGYATHPVETLSDIAGRFEGTIQCCSAATNDRNRCAFILDT